MTIKELVKISHSIAKEKGFWDEAICTNCSGTGKVIEKLPIWKTEDSSIKLKGSIKKTVKCNVCNGTGRIFSKVNIPEKLLLVITEIAEGCEYIRKHDYKPAKKWKKDDLGDELADAVIRIADLCGYLGIDLEWQIKQKIEYNKTRPYKHGKKF